MSIERGIRTAFALARLVLGIDVLTKAAIVALVEPGAQHVWLPVFNIVLLLLNRGAAFSLLHDAGGWQRAFFIAVALAASVLLWSMIRRPATTPAERLAFALILGGALGNMVDRVVRGAVVDWLDFHWGPHHFPAFNAADLGISLGVALMLAHAIGWTSRSTRQ